MKRPIYLDQDLKVYSVENTKVKKHERPYEHICSKCDVDSDLITGKPDEHCTEKREKRLSTVQRMERQKTKGEVTIIKKFTVNKTKDAYCRIAMTQIRMSGSEFHVDLNEFLLRTSKFVGCLQKVVLVLL